MRRSVLLLMPAGLAIALIAACLALIYSPAAAGPIIQYVKPQGTTSGACDSWANACDLQYALSQVTSGDELWVAQGVYTPGLDVHASFVLTTGVSLYGGFAGTETDRAQRNWQANLTILSGDITHNDPTDATGVVTDVNKIVRPNSCLIVFVSPKVTSVVVDGFTITAGFGRGFAPEYCDQWGGGMSIWKPGNATVRNTSFIGNFSGGFGGGLYNEGDSTFTNLLFLNNSANTAGGGVRTFGNTTFDQVTFIGNQSSMAGALDIQGTFNTVTITHAIFSKNIATHPVYTSSGGAIFTNVNLRLVVQDSIFSGNRAGWLGGAVVVSTGNAEFTNVLFSGNWASHEGGAFTTNGGAPNLTNVTFIGNYAGTYAGAIFLDFNPTYHTLTVTNSIIWGNRSGQTTDLYHHQITGNQGKVDIRYSDVEGDAPDGQGNLNVDPQFATPITVTQAPTTAGDFHLLPTSPLIDAGSNTYVRTATDLDGRPRRMDIPFVADTGEGIPPIVDLGAYELAWPHANAGPDQDVKWGAFVTLDGSASTPGAADPPLTYAWSQISGTAVILSSSAISMPTFTAPVAHTPATLVFSLVVTNTLNQPSPPAQVTVHVAAEPYYLWIPLIQNH